MQRARGRGTAASSPRARRSGAELRPAVPLLALPALLLLLGCLPAPCGALKSIASVGESVHKVRDVVEGALHTFEAELANDQDAVATEQYALARALQERGTDAVAAFVVGEVFPRPDAACSWDWTSMQCEPCGQCRRAGIAELLSPDRRAERAANESHWCVVRAVDDRARGRSCSVSLSATREGMMMDFQTKGVVGKRLYRAVLKFVERELVAPTNSTCYFDLARVRCEPSSMCSMDYQSWDVTPSRACRLISSPSAEPTSVAPACSWNGRLLRCEQEGRCHPEVWRWAGRVTKRHVWRARRLSSICAISLYTSVFANVNTLRIKARAEYERLHTFAVALAEDVEIARRRLARSMQKLYADTKIAVGKHARSCRNRLAAWHCSAVAWHHGVLAPGLEIAMSNGAGIAARLRSQLTPEKMEQHLRVISRSLQRTAHTSVGSAKMWFSTAKRMLAERVAQVKHAALDLQRALVQLDRSQIETGAKRLQVATLAASQRAVQAFHVALKRAQDAGKRSARDLSVAWRKVASKAAEKSAYLAASLNSTCTKGIMHLRAARACPYEWVPGQGSVNSDALVNIVRVPVHHWRVWRVLARQAIMNAVQSLRSQYKHAREVSTRILEEVEVELESAADRRSVDICALIPVEKQEVVWRWKYYSPWSAKKTANMIYSKILRQLMV